MTRSRREMKTLENYKDDNTNDNNYNNNFLKRRTIIITERGLS